MTHKLTVHVREIIEEAIAESFGVEVGLEEEIDPAVMASFVDALAAQVQNKLAATMQSPDGNNGHHPRNRLNELTGPEWLWFTKSVLRTKYPSILGHNLRRKQGGNKPPQLMQELIEFFTKPGDLVLDPFGGAGGTALGAHLAGRRSISIEINPGSIDLYQAVCEQESIAPHAFIQGDCRAVLPRLDEAHFDFIATDPPYSPELEKTMSFSLARKRYGHANRKSDYVTYSDDPRDLSKCGSFEAFFAALDEVGGELLRVLKPDHYLALILRDAYQGGEYIHTSAIVAQHYRQLGWTFKGEKIWYSTGSRIRPYGYPSAYVPNIIHQNILIFRKE